ncbi:MAG: ice-binding family protein [Gallionella sp.]|nr:ice-binding family protein [Gallionella sp.]
MNGLERVTRPLMWLMALLLAALVAGCGGGAGGGAPILGLPGVVSFAVTPATATIPVTGVQQYKAIATYSDGSSRDVTATSVWSSGTAAVATVVPTTGLATGVSSGISVITATLGGRTATANLTVSAATSTSFKITPTSAIIPVSGTQQFAAIQTFSDGTTIDRTTTALWSTSGASAANATVGAATGLATGVTVTPAGTPVIVNATFGALVATPATLIVNAATSVSFVVKPTTASVPVSGIQQFAAIQTFSDGTTFDRTTTSAWSTGGASAANATVGAATGLATGVTVTPAGVPVIINATFGALVATPANLTVNAATSVSFVVKPTTASVPLNGTQQFAAIQTFSDGTTFDRTTTSAWTSVNVPAGGPVVATLSVNGPGGGLATGTAVGTSSINATFGALVATPATLTVTAATVTSVSVTPPAASIVVGATQQYTALAILSDGSSSDVTLNPGTTWASASPLVAANPVAGLATGLTAGTANITASFGGKTSPAAGAILTVTAVNTGPVTPAPNLKTAAPFGIMAWDAMTINLGSHIYGDVALPGGVIASVVGTGGVNDGGVAPNLTSSAVTNSAGVTPGQINATNNGTLTPAQLTQVQADLNAAFLDLNTRVAPVTPLTTIASAANVPGGTFAAATDLSGYVLSPGLYTCACTYGLSSASGPLVLDAKGNPNAIFVIRSSLVGPSGLTSTTGSVVLQGGAQAKNVFWVMDNVTVGASTFFQGTVLAGHVITLNGFAIVQGRMLAGALGLVSGAITLTGTNIVTVPQ